MLIEILAGGCLLVLILLLIAKLKSNTSVKDDNYKLRTRVQDLERQREETKSFVTRVSSQLEAKEAIVYIKKYMGIE